MEVISLVLTRGKEVNTLNTMTFLGPFRDLRSQGKLLLSDLQRMVTPELKSVKRKPLEP